MARLSEHFDSEEFRSRDGAEHPIDPALIEVLERVRAWAGAPVTITSGYRSPAHNKRVGGAKNSLHMRGCAADIQVQGKTPTQVYTFLVQSADAPRLGLGLYRSWVHVDTRGYAARWRG